VEFFPGVTYFKPRGVPLGELEEIVLNLDETEAIRLSDLDGLGQVESARKMKVSQSTFQRILSRAHKKIAEVLIQGKAIKIQGGEFVMTKRPVRQFKCEGCGNIWEVPFGTGKKGIELKCPKCKAGTIHRIDVSGHGFGCQWWGRRNK